MLTKTKSFPHTLSGRQEALRRLGHLPLLQDSCWCVSVHERGVGATAAAATTTTTTITRRWSHRTHRCATSIVVLPRTVEPPPTAASLTRRNAFFERSQVLLRDVPVHHHTTPPCDMGHKEVPNERTNERTDQPTNQRTNQPSKPTASAAGSATTIGNVISGGGGGGMYLWCRAITKQAKRRSACVAARALQSTQTCKQTPQRTHKLDPVARSVTRQMPSAGLWRSTTTARTRPPGLPPSGCQNMCVPGTIDAADGDAACAKSPNRCRDRPPPSSPRAGGGLLLACPCASCGGRAVCVLTPRSRSLLFLLLLSRWL